MSTSLLITLELDVTFMQKTVFITKHYTFPALGIAKSFHDSATLFA